MAQVVKLKRGSGSDPQASDLVVGEVAVRTDNGKLFTKKDDGNVAEISGGGIDDGDKGDISVSNSGATFTIDNDVVTYAKIQNVSATNRILGRDSSGAGNIEEITPANLRTMINVEDGATADQSNSEIKTAYEANSNTNAFTDALLSKLNGIAASATNVTNNNQLTNGAGYITATLTNEQVQDIVGAMVSGNTESGITVTYQDGDGTLDFSVASQTDNNFTNADHSKLDGIEAGATADQSASEILTLIKTVDGAGSGLDADTVDGIAGGSFLRGDVDDTTTAHLTFNRTSDAKFSLQGSQNPYFDLREGTTEKVRFQWNSGGFIEITNKESNEALRIASGSNGLAFVEGGSERTVYHTGNLSVGDGGLTSNNFTDADHSKLNGIESGATADQSASEILTLIKTVDGSGSGLDADTLDGANASVSASNSTIVQRHSSGYIFANYFNTTANDVSSGVTKVMVETGNDNYIRHGTAAAVRSFLNVADGATNVTNNNQLTNGAGYVTSSGNTIIGTDSDINTSGATVIDQLNMTDGVITSHSTRTLTLANLGYTGATNANYITNNNQLSNGAGYLTSSSTLSSSRLSGALPAIDGSALTGISAGATGGGSDECFYENSQTITTNYTITNGKNAMSAGPITINSGVTVTVGSGENWTVV